MTNNNATNQTVDELFTLPMENSLVLGGLILLLATYLFKKRSSKLQHPWPKVPGALPIIGNPIPGGMANLSHAMEHWATLYGAESGVFECNIFGQRLIVCCTDEKVSVVESHRPFNVTRRARVNRAFKSVYADGLFSAEGDVWRKDRRLFGPALNKKHVRDYVDIIKLVASRLITKWKKEMNEEEAVVTINSDLTCYTMDIISLVAFAQDLDSLNKGERGLAKDVKYMLSKVTSRIFLPPYWNIPVIGQYIDGAGWTAYRLKQRFHKIIEEHESAISRISSNDKSDNENDDVPQQNDASKSFLGKTLLQSRKDNTTLTENRLIGNLLTMFAAGSETSFNTICSCLHEICIDKTGLQEELATEVLNVSLEDAGLEELNEGLPRLQSFIYEVLRLKGPAPFMGVENTKPLEIDGVVLPPKTALFLLFRHASKLDSTDISKQTPRGPKDAPPNIFCARRWLIMKGEKEEGGVVVTKNLSAIRPSFKTGFRPFGSGMRVCPGRDLAEEEILIALAFILSNFEIKLEKGHPPIKFITRMTETPDIDIRLALKPRKVN